MWNNNVQTIIGNVKDTLNMELPIQAANRAKYLVLFSEPCGIVESIGCGEHSFTAFCPEYDFEKLY